MVTNFLCGDVMHIFPFRTLFLQSSHTIKSHRGFCTQSFHSKFLLVWNTYYSELLTSLKCKMVPCIIFSRQDRRYNEPRRWFHWYHLWYLERETQRNIYSECRSYDQKTEFSTRKESWFWKWEETAEGDKFVRSVQVNFPFSSFFSKGRLFHQIFDLSPSDEAP